MLVLGEKKLAAQDVEGAILCAQAGLDELGTDYTSPQTIDDTDLKIRLAQRRIKEGHARDGASVLLNMLKIRQDLYLKHHAVTLVE